MSYILALDAGTTSVRAMLFDHDGLIKALAQQEFPQHFPHSGWVEHDPQDIWAAQKAVIQAALQPARVTAAEVAAVGITNQRETTLVWDRQTGVPIARAIVWQDRRTADHCARLRAAGLEPLFRERTGLCLDPYFSGTKLAWLLDHVPGARARAERGELAFGTVDTWLVWQLTGGRQHLTDPSNAARTLLLNIHTGAWDEELLAALRIPREVLPAVRSSSEIYDEVQGLGELAGVPIGGIAGDQQAALFGQLCLQPGMTKNTYGTGCFLLQMTGERPVASQNRLLTTIAWQIGSQRAYALEGSVFVGGAVVQWLRDALHLGRTAEEIARLAATVPDSGGVLFVPAFTGLGAPYWDPYARGMLLGLTRGTSAAHVARAALEGVAHQVADLLQAMHADTGVPLTELRADGGAARSDLLLQFQADILGVPVVRPAITETTSLGAAYLAGLAAGFWRNTQEIAAHWQADRRFEPHRAPAAVERLRHRWRLAVQRASEWESENHES